MWRPMISGVLCGLGASALMLLFAWWVTPAIVTAAIAFLALPAWVRIVGLIIVAAALLTAGQLVWPGRKRS